MKTSRITVARLYNLGSYEHIRYEISVDLSEGESASAALLGLERVLAGLNPKTSTHNRIEISRQHRNIEEMRRCLGEDGPDRFIQRYGGFTGTPEEYIARCEKSLMEDIAKRDAWEARSKKARELLDDLGGASEWKDAKMDWENADY